MLQFRNKEFIMPEDKSIVLWHDWHDERQYGEFTKEDSLETICSLRFVL